MNDNLENLWIEIENISDFDKINNISIFEILLNKNLYFDSIKYNITFNEETFKQYLINNLNIEKLNYLKINNFEYLEDKLVWIYWNELNLHFENKENLSFYYKIDIPKELTISTDWSNIIEIPISLENNIEQFLLKYSSLIFNINLNYKIELNWKDYNILNINKDNFNKYIAIKNNKNVFNYNDNFYNELEKEIIKNLNIENSNVSNFELIEIDEKIIKYKKNKLFEKNLTINDVLFLNEEIQINFNNDKENIVKQFNQYYELKIPENIEYKSEICNIANWLWIDKHFNSKINEILKLNSNIKLDKFNNDLKLITTILFFYKIPLLNENSTLNNIYWIESKDKFNLYNYIPNFEIDFFNKRNNIFLNNDYWFLITCKDNNLTIFSNSKPFANHFWPIETKVLEKWIIDYNDLYKTINLYKIKEK